MSTREMLLVMGVLVLMGIGFTTLHRQNMWMISSITDQRSLVAVTMAGQSLLEAVSCLKFDENIGVYPPEYFPEYLTPPSAFGSDGEARSEYDDLDDYQNYEDTIAINDLSVQRAVSVRYVTEGLASSSVPTRYKEVTVTSQSDAMDLPITQKQVFSCKKYTTS